MGREASPPRPLGRRDIGANSVVDAPGLTSFGNMSCFKTTARRRDPLPPLPTTRTASSLSVVEVVDGRRSCRMSSRGDSGC